MVASDHRIAAICVCRTCGYEEAMVFPEGVDESTLECSNCGHPTSEAVGYTQPFSESPLRNPNHPFCRCGTKYHGLSRSLSPEPPKLPRLPCVFSDFMKARIATSKMVDELFDDDEAQGDEK